MCVCRHVCRPFGAALTDRINQTSNETTPSTAATLSVVSNTNRLQPTRGMTQSNDLLTKMKNDSNDDNTKTSVHGTDKRDHGMFASTTLTRTPSSASQTRWIKRAVPIGFIFLLLAQSPVCFAFSPAAVPSTTTTSTTLSRTMAPSGSSTKRSSLIRPIRQNNGGSKGGRAGNGLIERFHRSETSTHLASLVSATDGSINEEGMYTKRMDQPGLQLVCVVA